MKLTNTRYISLFFLHTALMDRLQSFPQLSGQLQIQKVSCRPVKLQYERLWGCCLVAREFELLLFWKKSWMCSALSRYLFYLNTHIQIFVYSSFFNFFFKARWTVLWRRRYHLHLRHGKSKTSHTDWILLRCSISLLKFFPFSLQSDTNWWKGTCKGRTGLIPSNYGNV